MTPGKSGDEPAKEDEIVEGPALIRGSRFAPGSTCDLWTRAAADAALRKGSAADFPQTKIEARCEVLARELELLKVRDAVGPETTEELSQRLSDRKFYDQNLRERMEAVHPGATLFALYFPPSSIVRQEMGEEPGQSSAAIFATGEALISIPAKTRRGAPTVADLTVPVRVSGHIQDGRFALDGVEFVPQSAYFAPLIPDRVTRPRRAAQR